MNTRAAIDGWFTTDTDAPALLGSRCRGCGTYAFPAESLACRNPDCPGGERDVVPLSRRGRIWSYTNACYTPPPPYVAADPFEPFCIAAVELERERMVVMGQVVPGVRVEDLAVGDEVEVFLGRLFEDEETDSEVLVWQWKPVVEGGGSGGGGGGDRGGGGAG